MRFCLFGMVMAVFVSACSGPVHKTSEEIELITKNYPIVWDHLKGKPREVKSSSGKVILRPCDELNELHQNLFVQLYTDENAVKMYLDGAVRTREEALNLLKSHSARWDTGVLLSGFVGYSPNSVPFVHCGIGLFPAKGMAEVFILELPGFRGKGLGKEVMNALISWGRFLKDMGLSAFPDITQSGIHTLIARVSPENVASLKLLLQAGFTMEFSIDSLKKEFGDYQPSQGNIIKQQLQLAGKTYIVNVITTQRRPTPKVILIKRL